MLGEPWGKYGRMAAANNIILIFTEADKKYPHCYDVWGYSGKDFATKYGMQIKAFMGMIDRVTS